MAHHKLAESYLERLIDAERIIFNLKRTAEDMQACNDALTAENTALTAQLSTIKFDKALTELADRIKAMVGLHAHDMESPAAGAELAEIDQRAALVRKIQERSEQDQVVASAAQEYGRQEWEEDEADEAFETSAIHVSEGAQEETGYGAETETMDLEDSTDGVMTPGTQSSAEYPEPDEDLADMQAKAAQCEEATQLISELQAYAVELRDEVNALQADKAEETTRYGEQVWKCDRLSEALAVEQAKVVDLEEALAARGESAARVSEDTSEMEVINSHLQICNDDLTADYAAPCTEPTAESTKLVNAGKKIFGLKHRIVELKKNLEQSLHDHSVCSETEASLRAQVAEERAGREKEAAMCAELTAKLEAVQAGAAQREEGADAYHKRFREYVSKKLTAESDALHARITAETARCEVQANVNVALRGELADECAKVGRLEKALTMKEAAERVSETTVKSAIRTDSGFRSSSSEPGVVTRLPENASQGAGDDDMEAERNSCEPERVSLQATEVSVECDKNEVEKFQQAIERDLDRTIELIKASLKRDPIDSHEKRLTGHRNELDRSYNEVAAERKMQYIVGPLLNPALNKIFAELRAYGKSLHPKGNQALQAAADTMVKSASRLEIAEERLEAAELAYKERKHHGKAFREMKQQDMADFMARVRKAHPPR